MTFWFIKNEEPQGHPADWGVHIDGWVNLFAESDRYRIEATIPCSLEDITARDYVESDHLDLDQLSTQST